MLYNTVMSMSILFIIFMCMGLTSGKCYGVNNDIDYESETCTYKDMEEAFISNNYYVKVWSGSYNSGAQHYIILNENGFYEKTYVLEYRCHGEVFKPLDLTENTLDYYISNFTRIK